MLKIMIVSFAVCGILAGFGAYMITSYAASRSKAPTKALSPWIPAITVFAVVWASMSLGFLHWVSKLS
jgi:flagellar basal body-associated protein FliL